MTDYTWVISGPETRELTEADDRRLDFQVDGSATATFTMSGLSEEAAAIQELETDLTVYRDGVKLFRGRIIAEQDSLTASNHTVSFTAKDYRGLLEYRITGPGVTSYDGVDQAAIAWDLINLTQLKPGGDLGITNGAGTSSGFTRVRTINAGSKIAEELTSLGRLESGFEWEVSEELELNRWFPRRGADNGVQLDYGGLCAALNRTLMPDFANVVQVQGSNETNVTERTVASIASDPRGRWELFRGYPTIKEQATVDSRATWVLGETAVVRPGYAAEVTAGRWEGRNHIWLGDTVGLQVKSGRLAVDSDQRVVTIGIGISSSDVETVYLGLIDATIYS